jgi:hypothetical protein
LLIAPRRLFGFERRGISTLKVVGIVLVFVGALCVQLVSRQQAMRVMPVVAVVEQQQQDEAAREMELVQVHDGNDGVIEERSVVRE